jgi:hypothetical protein
MGFGSGGAVGEEGHGQCVSPAGTWNLPCRTAFPRSLSHLGWWGQAGLGIKKRKGVTGNRFTVLAAGGR